MPEPVYIAEVLMLRQYFRIIKMNDSRLKKFINGIKLFMNKIVHSLGQVKLSHDFDPEIGPSGLHVLSQN